MNICFCSQEYPPDTHVGGIGTYTYNVASALAAIGHTVHVITSTPDRGRSYTDNGVAVYRIHHCNSRPLELSRLRYSRAVASQLNRMRCRFDLVQASEYASEAFWFSLHRRTPLVTRLATPTFMLQRLGGERPGRRFCAFLEKQQALRSDGIFSSTRALADAVSRGWTIDSGRIAVIPNSVDVSRIVRLAANGGCPEELHGRDFLLYFGRLEERKGIRVLADALPRVLEEFSSLLVLFVGADSGYHGKPLRDYIKTRAGGHSHRIRFFDNLPHSELLPIVGAAKLVVLPSLWEAFGFVSVEAMALGRPVIATSGSGFEEIIENNVSGYLVTPGNPSALAEKIVQSLRDDTGLHRISAGARERARDFEVSRVAPKLIAYYQDIRARWSRQHPQAVGNA
jgi:glycogen synthase